MESKQPGDHEQCPIGLNYGYLNLTGSINHKSTFSESCGTGGLLRSSAVPLDWSKVPLVQLLWVRF